MTIHASAVSARADIDTGVPGLDDVLGGGLVSGGLYLIEGMAGAGKTILSSQIGFHRIRQGERVLYLTLIAESHDKLLSHLKSLSFFNDAAVAEQMLFVSGYHELIEDGLDGFLKLIAANLSEYRPRMMIIDGFRSARDFSGTDLVLSKFIHELNALVAALDCTTLLLAPLSGNEARPEHTLVDGLIELSRYSDGMRRARELEVHKMRGRDHLLGKHFFRISSHGLSVFPRLEAGHTLSAAPMELHTRLGFGLPRLDALLGGGFVKGSTTTLMGPSGVGKTLLCLQFLAAGLAQGEKAVYLGFYESPQRLTGKAEAVSIPLAAAIEDGRLLIQWHPSIELSIDEIAATVVQAVGESGATRLVIDGLDGFRDSALRPARFGLFLNAFSNQLRELGVTILMTEELPLYGDAGSARGVRLSALSENLVLLRYLQSGSRLRHTIAVVKVRESAHDASLRELVIDSGGLDVIDSLGNADSDVDPASTDGLPATLKTRSDG